MESNEKLYRQAIEAGKNRDYTESFKLFQNLVSTTDDFPSSFLYMGRCLHAMGDRSGAIRFFRYFLKRFPGSPAGLFFMGRSYLALGVWNRGLSLLNRVYRINPDYPQLKAFLGFGFLRYKKIDQAVEFLGLAVEEDPENEKLYQAYLNALYLQGIKSFYREERDYSRQVFEFLYSKGVHTTLLFLHMAIIEKESGNFANSISWYDRALASSPDDQLIKLQRAEVLYLSGEKDSAFSEWENLPFFEEIRKESVNHLTLKRISAIEHYNSGKFRKAFYFATTILKEEKDPAMHLLAGESARNLGNFRIAANHYRRVIEKAPDMLEPRYGLVMTYWQEERWSDALKELERIRRIVPDDDLSRYYRTLCMSRLETEPGQILYAVMDEIRISGPDPWLLTALGKEYFLMDIPELSEKWFRKALKLKDDHKDAWSGLIDVLAVRDDSDSLLETFRLYLEKWGDDLHARKEFANLLFREKKYEEAAGEIERLLPYFSGDSGVNRMLAFCYRECGNFQEAALTYRQLLRNEPDNQVYLRSIVYCLEKNGQRDIAINILEKAFAFIKPDSTMYLILGVLLYREKRLDHALAVFRKSGEMTPDDWRPLYNMGIIYRDKGLKDYAETYFSRSRKKKNKTDLDRQE